MLKIDLHYFPCIGYMRLLAQHKEVCFTGDVIFKRSSFQNRTILAGPGGAVSISIPVVGGRSNKLPFNQVMIDHASHWQRDHFRTLTSLYGRSPFFFHYSDALKELYQESHPTLFSWNLRCLQWILINTKTTGSMRFYESSSFFSSSVACEDHSDFFHPQNYSSSKNGPFLRYPQVFEDRIPFLPNLSVLDLLFNLGPVGVQEKLLLVDSPDNQWSI